MCLCEFDKKLRSSLDINELCSECTSKNAKKNNSLVDGAVDNAGSCLRTGLFDFVLQNPPFVVTTSEELHKSQKEQDLSASCSGGNNGTELLLSSRLPKALKLLNYSGCLYIVIGKEIPDGEADASQVSILTESEFYWPMRR